MRAGSGRSALVGLERGEDGIATDFLFKLLPDRRHRLAPFILLRAGQGQDFGFFVIDDFLAEIGGFVIRHLVAELDRLNHGLIQALADVCGQTIPPGCIGDH